MTDNTTDTIQPLQPVTVEEKKTYFRQKRVDLGVFDSRWTENAYLLVRTLQYRDVLGFMNGINKLKRREYRLRKEIKQLQIEVEDLPMKECTELLDLIETKETELDELIQAKIMTVINLCKDNLISGYVFDESTGGLRQAVKDDIESFDVEITEVISKAIVGDFEKKV